MRLLALPVSLIALCSTALGQPVERVTVVRPASGTTSAVVAELARGIAPYCALEECDGSDLAARAGRGVVVVPAAACGEDGVADGVSRALEGRAVVLLPEGVPTPLALGIRAWTLPSIWTHAWGCCDPLVGYATGAGAGQCVAPSPELAEGARYDAIVLAGREAGQAEAVVGFALRYHRGPRAGAAIAVLGLQGLDNPLVAAGWPRFLELVRWLRQPFLVVGGPDYASVRPREAIRVPLEVAAPVSDRRSLVAKVRLTDPAGAALAQDAETSSWIRERADGGLDTLRAVARFEPQRWRVPWVAVETKLLELDPRREVDSVRGIAAVWSDSDLRRYPEARVTGRRVVTRAGAMPAFSCVGPRPWRGLAGGYGEVNDAAAWWETFIALADSGATSVVLSMEGAAASTETARRLDEGRVALALAAGLTPELVVPSGTEPAGPASLPCVLVSPDVHRSTIGQGWDPARSLPPPYAGEGPLRIEALAAECQGPVRLQSQVPLDPDVAWWTTLLGLAGAMVDVSDGWPPEPSSGLLRHNMLARLLGVGNYAAEVALLLDGGGRTPEAADALNADGYSWCAIGSARPGSIAPSVRVVVAPDPAQWSRDIATYAESGGFVLVRGALPSDVRQVEATVAMPFGDAARVGEGWVAALPTLEPGVLAAALGWAGVSPSAEAAGSGGRILRAVPASGGEVVGLFAGGEAHERRAALVSGRRVELGVRPGAPGVVAANVAGVWLVASSGIVSVGDQVLVEAPDDCTVTVVSLQGTPIQSSRDFLVFVDSERAVEVKVHLEPAAGGKPRMVLAATAPWQRRLREVARRGAKLTDWTLLMSVRPEDRGRPLALAQDWRLPKAMDRIARLIW